jgi:hypothetical protein
VRVGGELLNLVRSSEARSVYVVGTGRDAGKTTALRAIYAAALDAGIRCGVASIGRDSDAAFRDDMRPKPRLWLAPPTVFVTARGTLPLSPACEILELSDLRSAAGTLLYARAVSSAFYELVGPPTASGLREIVDGLASRCDFVIVDGAVDRVAALAGSSGAIVVACGAATAATEHEAVGDVVALVARLRTPAMDPRAPAIHVDGALTAADAAAYVAAGEMRQIVVRDPTQIALGGRAAETAFARLTIRCERPLRVIAATVASIGPQRSFEPRAFAAQVARATGLPVFDVYAGARAA